MSKVLQAVKGSVKSGCCVLVMKKGMPFGVHLGGINPYILIDMNHAQAPNSKSDRKADYILVGLIQRGNNSNASEWVVPVETKNGSLKRKAHAQLQASTNLLSGFIPNDLIFEFQPVIFFNKGANKVVREYFKKNPIEWRGHSSKKRFVRTVSRNQVDSHGLHLKKFLLSPPSK